MVQVDIDLIHRDNCSENIFKGREEWTYIKEINIKYIYRVTSRGSDFKDDPKLSKYDVSKVEFCLLP